MNLKGVKFLCVKLSNFLQANDFLFRMQTLKIVKLNFMALNLI